MTEDRSPGRLRRAFAAARSQWQRDRVPAGNYYGGITHGGLRNPNTGMGMPGLDKVEGSFFTPTRFFWQAPLEVLGVQSGAAQNFIDYPIDDQFIRWREWGGDDESAAQKMADMEEELNVTEQLAKALKAGRQYGTGVLIIMSKEARLTDPFMPERIRPGDVTALRVFHRYEMSIHQRDYDLMSPNWGGPEFYEVFPRRGGHMTVHHSRVLRFDGITTPSDSGFSVYDWDWGVSALVPVIISIVEDQALINSIGHLAQQASIPVLMIRQLRMALSGGFNPDDTTSPSAENIGEQVNRMMSNYRLLMLDKEGEEFQRVQVNWSGMPLLMDKFQERLAAWARIPQTRWMGRSPAGLNATGDSDMHNYVMMIEALREKILAPRLKLLDLAVARNAGLRDVPEFEWLSLINMSDKDRADIFKTKAEGVKILLDGYIADEVEGREIMSGDEVAGVLEGEPPERPDLTEMPDDDPFGDGGDGGGDADADPA